MSAEMTASRVCRGCGCTDEDGCVVEATGLFATFADEIEAVGCHWVEPDLCSGCAEPETRLRGPVVDHRPAPAA